MKYLIIGIIVVLVFANMCSKNDPPPAASAPPPASVKIITPAEHLASAKKDLEGYVPRKKWGNVDSAKKHLNAIKKDALERPEAERLLKEVAKREKEITVESKKIAAGLMKQQRIQIAKTMERNMLDKGFDAYVTTQGPQNETLKIKFILISRPFVHQMCNDGETMGNFRNVGFKKIIFTDGYDSTWTVDLTK